MTRQPARSGWFGSQRNSSHVSHPSSGRRFRGSPFLLCLGRIRQAANTITGGGSTLAEFDYFVEFAAFNAGQGGTSATFANPAPATGNNVLYWPAGSGSGQAAFLNNDISCDANKVLGTNGADGKAGDCSNTVGGAAAVSYGASDSTLTSTQINQWATSSVGQAVAGNLIQLPSMGVGISFPIVNKTITKNGATPADVAVAGGLVLTDSDLCGIFSGKITDWSGVTNYVKDKVTPGTINVAYRSDGSGTSFLLLNHLSYVCTASNSNFPMPLVVSTSFASAFTGGTPPSNFVGEKGSSGVANYLSGTLGGTNVAPTSAIGYLSPDFTTVDPNSNAFIGQDNPPDQKSTLVVAAVTNGARPYIPTVANVAAALNHPVAADSQNTTAPTTKALANNPSAYVPLIGEAHHRLPGRRLHHVRLRAVLPERQRGDRYRQLPDGSFPGVRQLRHHDQQQRFRDDLDLGRQGVRCRDHAQHPYQHVEVQRQHPEHDRLQGRENRPLNPVAC